MVQIIQKVIYPDFMFIEIFLLLIHSSYLLLVYLLFLFIDLFDCMFFGKLVASRFL